MAKILNIDGAKLNIDSTNIKDNYVLQPQVQQVTAGNDLNDVVTVGIYRLEHNITNLPSDEYRWGQMLVLYGGGDTGMQIIFSCQGASPCYRFWVGTTTKNFSDWFYLSQTT